MKLYSAYIIDNMTKEERLISDSLDFLDVSRLKANEYKISADFKLIIHETPSESFKITSTATSERLDVGRSGDDQEEELIDLKTVDCRLFSKTPPATTIRPASCDPSITIKMFKGFNLDKVVLINSCGHYSTHDLKPGTHYYSKPALTAEQAKARQRKIDAEKAAQESKSVMRRKEIQDRERLADLAGNDITRIDSTILKARYVHQ